MALWYEKHIKYCSCQKYPFLRKFVSELFGMFAFVFIASGTVATAIFYTPASINDSSDILYINVGIAFGYTTGLYICSENVGYLNMALTIVFWILGKMKRMDAVAYVLAQFCGALLAGSFIYLLYEDEFEIDEPRENLTSLIFSSSVNPSGDFFWRAVIDQILKTMVFTIGVMAIIDEQKNKQQDNPLKTIKPSKRFEPLMIGLVLFLVGIAFSYYARFYFNPLQDLSGLIFVKAANLSKTKWWGFAQVICPVSGAIVAAIIYILVIENNHMKPAEIEGDSADLISPVRSVNIDSEPQTSKTS